MRAEERKKLKEGSQNYELPILLNTNPGIQPIAEIIKTGRQYDKTSLKSLQLNEICSRQLEETNATSQQADSFDSKSYWVGYWVVRRST